MRTGRDNINSIVMLRRSNINSEAMILTAQKFVKKSLYSFWKYKSPI
jgi:hypothetical protein